MPRLSIAMLVCLLATGSPRLAAAQSQSLFGSGGALSRTGLSSTQSSSSRFGGSGSTGSGYAFGGSGGMGSGGFGSGSSGMSGGSGTFSGPQFNQLGALSNSAGTGFVGRTNTGFAGNRMAGQTGAGTGASAASFGGGGGSRGGRGAFNQGGFGQSGSASGFGNRDSTASTRTQIQPQYRVSFDYPSSGPTVAGVRLRQRLEELPSRLPELSGVTVEIRDEGRVTLIGNVTTQSAKELAETIVRLEPGVNDVANNLVVIGPLR